MTPANIVLYVVLLLSVGIMNQIMAGLHFVIRIFNDGRMEEMDAAHKASNEDARDLVWKNLLWAVGDGHLNDPTHIEVHAREVAESNGCRESMI